MGLQILQATSEEERALFRELARRTHVQGHGQPLRLLRGGAEPIDLPRRVSEILYLLASILAEGRAVTVLVEPSSRLLTTSEAAELLDVSRQYLCRLLDRGDIPFVRVGKHRRIRVEDLMRYRERRDAARREKLRELTRLSQELGLYAESLGDTI
jgi:excisionase family DNA binding protein